MTKGLLPVPLHVTPGSGCFVLSGSTTVHCTPRLDGAARWLRSTLSAATGFALPAGTLAADADISLVEDADLPAEGYRLEVTADRVTISASQDAGAFWAAQTLRQLLGPDAFRRAPVRGGAWTLPVCTIEDQPRFGWRGCLLDVARHFVPKDAVLRFVDLMAAHKLNVLHLHLTDDQGWRMEILRYPLLTSVGGWRTESELGRAEPAVRDGRPHGGYYTQDDLREIVAYAGERHVMVLPEIDVPGHTQAAIAAYPELGNVEPGGPDQRPTVWTGWGINENVLNVDEPTLTFFGNVLDEVMDVFPAPYLSLGGDEVPTLQWRQSPAAQARMRSLGLPDEASLQSWFIGVLAARLRSRGRRLVVWDELVDTGLPEGALVQSWRGVEGGIAAAEAGHDVVMCPEQDVYLDHRQSDHPDEPIPVGYARGVDDVHRYDPCPPGLDPRVGERILGTQAQVWTEHLDGPRRIDYAAFPRLAGFAEVAWSDPASLDHDGFLDRLGRHHLPRLDALGVEYRPLEGPLPWQTRPGVAGHPR